MMYDDIITENGVAKSLWPNNDVIVTAYPLDLHYLAWDPLHRCKYRPVCGMQQILVCNQLCFQKWMPDNY